MLKLSTLEMTNFMCVPHAVLDFTEAKNVLVVGENGEGKSTILEAIAFCLSEHKKADSFQDYIKEFEDSANVKLSGFIQNEPISFNMTIISGESTVQREVVYKGETLRNSQVTDLLEKLELKYYEKIIMSMQDDGDITKLTPTKRAEYLQKLLNFDFSDKVEDCKEQVKEIQEKIDNSLAKVDFNTKSIEVRRTEIKEPSPITFTEEDVKTLQSEISQLSAKIAKFNEDIAEKDNISRSQLVKSDEVNSIKREIITLQSSLDREAEKKAQAESLTVNKNEIEAEIEKLKRTVFEEPKDLSAAQEKRDGLVRDVAGVKADLAHAVKSLNLVKQGVCPECGHQFEEGEEAKYQAEYSSLLEKVNILESELANAESEVSSITAFNRGIETKKNGVENNISIKTHELSNVNRQLELLSGGASVDQVKEAITEKNNLLNTKVGELNAIGEKLKSYSTLAEDYSKATSEMSSKQNTLNSYSQATLENNLIVQNNLKIKDAIQVMEAEIEELHKKVESYRAQKQTMEETIQILDKLLPNYIIIKTCEKLDKKINDVVHRVFPAMEVRLFQGKKGVELYFTMARDKVKNFEKENLKNIKMASGFQKATVSVAFKIALCEAYGLRFSFFDEVEQAASEKNSDILLKMITTSSLFDQVFIITHKPTVRDTIKSVAPNLITYYVSKGKFSLDEDEF